MLRIENELEADHRKERSDCQNDQTTEPRRQRPEVHVGLRRSQYRGAFRVLLLTGKPTSSALTRQSRAATSVSRVTGLVRLARCHKKKRPDTSATSGEDAK